MELKNTQQKLKEGEKELIKGLEKDVKEAFRSNDLPRLTEACERLKNLSPDNHMAQALVRKLEAKNRTQKLRSYQRMLKTVLRQHDAEKLCTLAEELRAFDPGGKAAEKWLKKAEKLRKKISAGPGFSLDVSWLRHWLQKLHAFSGKAAQKPSATIVIPSVKVVESDYKEKDSGNFRSVVGGNVFTKMFSVSPSVKSSTSIIDTIVAKADLKEEKSTSDRMTDRHKEGDAGIKLALFSGIFLNFTVIFIVFSAAFLYIEWIDKNNTFLSLFGVTENTGGRLYASAEELTGFKRQEAVFNKNIELYKGGYNDKALLTVQSLINQRINWPDVFLKINEVTNSVYELNDFFRYIQYNNYSFDAESGSIRVTGTLSDPLGRNLTRLAELEEAFKTYPGDKNNPADTTTSYFTNFRELTSFSKSLDPMTGRYISSFQLSFSLNK